MARKRLGIIVFAFFIIALAVFIVSYWLPGHTLILGHDSGYRLPIVEFWLSLFSLWAPVLNFGTKILFNPAVSAVHVPEVVSWLISRDIYVAQRFVFIFWHVANLSSIGAAWLFVGSKRKRGFPFSALVIASVLYAVNFLNLHAWSVIWRTKFSVQFLLPFLVFYLYETLQEGRLHWRRLVILALLASVFNGGGSPPLYGPLLVAWVTTGLYCVCIERKRKQTFLLFLKITTVLSVIFAALSSYWLVPYVYYAVSSYTKELQVQGGVGGILGIVDAVSKNASILNIFRMQGLPAWDPKTQFPFMREYINNPLLVIASFVWPLASLWAFFLAKGEKEKKFIGLFLALLIVGIFFTAGSHPPTGFLFSFLVETVPGFGIFRTAFYKFGILPWFALSALTGFTFARFARKAGSYSKRKFVESLIVILLLTGILWYHAPFLRGSFFDYNLPFTNKITLPGYVTQTARYIEETTRQNDKILLMPRFDESRMDGYAWGYWSPDPLPRMILNRPIVSDANNPPAIVDGIYRAFTQKQFDEFIALLRVSGIRTILWRSDILYSDKKAYGNTEETMENDLSSLPQIKKTASFGKWRVYTVLPDRRMDLFDAQSVYITSRESYADFLAAMRIVDPSIASLNPTLIAPPKPNSLGGFFAATCPLCNPHQRARLDSRSGFTPVFLLPHSKLYFIKKWRERRLLETASKSTEDFIRLRYILIRERLSEIHEYMRSKDNRIHTAIIQTADEIRIQLAGLQRLFSSLAPVSGTIAREEFAYALGGFHKAVEILKKADTTGADFSVLGEVFSRVEMDLNQKRTGQGADVYIIDIPVTDVYDIIVVGGSERGSDMRLDGVPLSGKRAALTRGVHTFETSGASGLFVAHKSKVTETQPPSIEFLDGTTTRFRVRVTGASDPYILTFNQTYDPGWTARVFKSTKRRRDIPEEDHVLVNGYANGWYVEDAGNYDIEVIFRPQIFVWVGLAVSGVAFGCAAVFLLRKTS